MKHIFVVVPLILTCVMLTICTSENQKSAAVTIDLNDAEHITDTLFFVAYGIDELFPVIPDHKGQYTLQVETEQPRMVSTYFAGKQYRFFIGPGDHLMVKAGPDGQIDFKGNGAAEAEVIHQMDELAAKRILDIDIEKITPDELSDMFDSIYQESINILDGKKTDISPAFYQYITVALLYQCLDQKMSVPFNIRHIQQKSFPESLPARYWDLGKMVELDERLLAVEEYARFINGTYVYYLQDNEFRERGERPVLSPDEDMEYMYHLICRYYPEKMCAVVLPEYLKGWMRNVTDVRTLKPVMDEYSTKYGQINPEQVKHIQETYQNILLTAAGAELPDFMLENIDGEQVSLRSFVGKVIYIDFWASWCGPCRYEIKNESPKLHERYSNNPDVLFLYINVDESEPDWKKAVVQDKIQGVQLHAVGGLKSGICRIFDINGIPRYIIVGKEGKIFDNNAPRPSQKEASIRIDEALKNGTI